MTNITFSMGLNIPLLQKKMSLFSQTTDLALQLWSSNGMLLLSSREKENDMILPDEQLFHELLEYASEGNKHQPHALLSVQIDDDSFSYCVLIPPEHPQYLLISEPLSTTTSNSQLIDLIQLFFINENSTLGEQNCISVKLTHTLELYKSTDEEKYYSIARSYGRERQFLEAVKSGERSLIEPFLKGFNIEQLPSLCTFDALRSAKNHAIILCTLLCRTAIEAGLRVDVAMTASDSAIIAVEYIHTLSKLKEHIATLVYHYTDAISTLKTEGLTKNAIQVMHFMQHHLSEDISIEQTSDFTNLSKAQISKILKTEFHSTFSQYLIQLRVERAKFLLTNTDELIADISIACGFSEQSYFTKVFKKYVQVTPKEYRLNHTKTSR